MGIPLPIPGREKKKVTKICKRDGRIVDFDQEKITEAILKALEATDKGDKKRANKLSGKVANKLGKKFHERTIPAVEEVQDLVEEVLVDESLTATVRAYILYREQHKQIREYQAFVDSDKVMEGYLAQTDWLVKENANMSFSLQGLNNHVASAVSKHYWLNKIYSPEVRDAHNNGELHIHDLYMLAPYCTGWDLKDLMMQGFGGVSGKIQCKPPKHLRTAMGQIVNFFYTVQGEIAGAVAFSNFDTYLAPFIRYDNLDYKQVKQSMQEFLFNMNVPTRVGFQTPFTNVTLDLKVPKIIKDDAVIIGGQPRSEKYGEFQEEMDLFNKVFADVMMEGDASGRVFTFPIPTYNITKNFDWESEVTDKIFEMTAKYGTPYFSNFVNSDMDPDDTRSMCCRLRLDNRELRKRGGGLFGANPLTGSIGVVTINMSRIGHLAKDKKDYFERLDKLMRLGRQSLEVKRKMLDSFTDEGLYPYCRVYLEGVNKRFGTYWKNHFNTIGINGMNESMINFMGKSLTDKEANVFAGEVLDYMREKLMDYQIETNDLYNLESTPAEGTSYRFAKLDKENFPEIIVANEEAVRTRKADPFYTNSTHLPVDSTDDIFEALDLQDGLQTKYTGGTVFHGYIGEKLPDPAATRNLVKKIAENYHLPYYTITPTFSVCPEHGYLVGEHFHCPQCGAEAEVYSRVSGYLRPVQQWNKGKRAEFETRKEYKTGGRDS